MRKRTRGVRRVRQLTIFPRGGKRRGAGRKPNGAEPMMSHAARPGLDGRCPLMVTVRLRAGLPTLRTERVSAVLREAFAAGAERFGMRVIHFSVESNHIHFLVEAQQARSLTRGMKGLLVRVARRLNLQWGRKGRVLADRYHARPLRTPREVRNALVYVLLNAKKHGGAPIGAPAFTSGPWFDGWANPPGSPTAVGVRPPVVRPMTWLLSRGWKRHGLIELVESPALPRRDRGACDTGYRRVCA